MRMVVREASEVSEKLENFEVDEKVYVACWGAWMGGAH